MTSTAFANIGAILGRQDMSGAADDFTREEILGHLYAPTAFAVQDDDALVLTPAGRCKVQERGELTWFVWDGNDGAAVRFWMNTCSVADLFLKWRQLPELRREFADLTAPVVVPVPSIDSDGLATIYDIALAHIQPVVTASAKGRPDTQWGRHRRQVYAVLGAATQGLAGDTYELRQEGWAQEAQIATLAGKLARGAWLARDNADAVAAGKELTALGHRALAVALYKAIRQARA